MIAWGSWRRHSSARASAWEERRCCTTLLKDLLKGLLGHVLLDVRALLPGHGVAHLGVDVTALFLVLELGHCHKGLVVDLLSEIKYTELDQDRRGGCLMYSKYSMVSQYWRCGGP